MNAELNTVLSTKEVGFSMYKHSKFNDKRIYHSLYLLFTFLKFCLRDITPINHIRNTKRHHKNIKTSLGFLSVRRILVDWRPFVGQHSHSPAGVRVTLGHRNISLKTGFHIMIVFNHICFRVILLLTNYFLDFFFCPEHIIIILCTLKNSFIFII